MKVKNLEIENIQSYEYENIDFEEGETLIYGDNGSGKTTLLRAIFGALFQDRSASRIHSGYTLDKLVRRSADEGRIKLTFEVNKEEYIIEWVLAVTTNEDGEREYDGTTKCVLKSSALSEPVSGVKAVRSVVMDVIGMDAVSFVNSVYVQQGDITRLIYANQTERKEIIDDLLGLSEIDEQVDRLDEARLGTNDLIDSTEISIKEIEEQIEEYDRDSINSRISQTKSGIADIESDIEEKRNALSKKREALSDIEDKKEEYGGLEDEIQRLDETIAKKKDDLQTYESTLEEKREKKKNLQTRFKEVMGSISDYEEQLDVDSLERGVLQERIEDIQETLEEERERKSELVEELSEKKTTYTHLEEKQSELREQISELEKEIEEVSQKVETLQEKRTSVVSQFASDLSEYETQRAELVEEAKAEGIEIEESVKPETLRDHYFPNLLEEIGTDIEEAMASHGRYEVKQEQVSELVETGECPVCGAKHENGDHVETADVKEQVEQSQTRVESLEEQREHIRSLRDKARSLAEFKDELDDLRENLDNLEENVKEKEDKLNRLKTEKEQLNSELSEVSDQLSTTEEKIEQVERNRSESSSTVMELGKREDQMQSLLSLVEEKQELEESMEEVRMDLSNFEDLRETIVQEIADLEEDKSSVEGEIEEFESLEEINEKIENKNKEIEEINSDISSLEDEKDSLRDDLASLRGELEQLDNKEERRDSLKERLSRLKSYKSEILSVKESYIDVKKDLRKENIALLNKFANDVFEELHQGNITSIKIGPEYDIELNRADGTTIDPDMSSGGESNTINLAIRAGIYRLITEREGTETLPPFILDEPTQFLDDTHIGQLQDFIEAINQWDVPQFIIVSHEDSLIETADSILEVEVDRDKGVSTVTKKYGDNA